MKVDRRRHGPTPVIWVRFGTAKSWVPFNRFVHPHPVRCPGFTPRSIKSPQQSKPHFLPSHHATLTHSTCRELPVLHPCPAPSECSVTRRPPRKKAYWCRHSLCSCLLRPVSVFFRCILSLLTFQQGEIGESTYKQDLNLVIAFFAWSFWPASLLSSCRYASL